MCTVEGAERRATIDRHLHIHLEGLGPLIECLCHELPQVLRQGFAQLNTLITHQGAHMSTQLDALTAQVAANRTVIESAVTLIRGLAQQIQDAAGDPVKLQALVDDLQASDTALAQAVQDNTPAVP